MFYLVLCLLPGWLAGWWAGELAFGWLAGWVHCGMATQGREICFGLGWLADIYWAMTVGRPASKLNLFWFRLAAKYLLAYDKGGGHPVSKLSLFWFRIAA